MKTIKLELDFLIGPIVKDVFRIPNGNPRLFNCRVGSQKRINELEDE